MQFALGPKARAAGYRIEVHDTIGSTNAEALSRARGGDGGRLWVISAHQSAGRGRRGSRWATPVGNLAASLYLRVDCPASTAATLGFVAGLALDEALRRLVPALAVGTPYDGAAGGDETGCRLRLKWPNDVLLDGGKLAGILLEAESVGNGQLAVIVGIGVNVIAAPPALPYRGATIAGLAPDVTAADVFCGLSDEWVAFYRLWDDGAGFRRIRDLWLERAAGAGEAITVRVGGEALCGTFETIDGAGRLVLRLGDGAQRTVSAGDVHFAADA